MLTGRNLAGWRICGTQAASRGSCFRTFRTRAGQREIHQVRTYTQQTISRKLKGNKEEREPEKAEHQATELHKSTPKANRQLNLPAIDSYWQQRWATPEHRHTVESEEREKGVKQSKAYILPMFPYPSGNLHMGHMRVYTIADVLSRWKQMSGYNVLNPMGWDAFGLPADNAAIERGVEPASWTKSNIGKMRELLMEMNTGFDWSKELATCDPAFYKHTQKLFLLMKEHGLAYQAEGMVNWDPLDRTVLANEQVDRDGCSWRSGAKVEKRMLKQWYLKVTEFKQALLDDLDMLDRDGKWPEGVLSQQRHWIGRSKGAKFKFMVGSTEQGPFSYRPIQVFTTRPDTLLGVQFLAVSASHHLVKERLAHDTELQEFVNQMATMPDDSKAGFLLRNVTAVNPAVTLMKTPGEMPASVPVFVAPYVLKGYGEGAVMGVPGHDERDHAFWKLNCPGRAIRAVVGPANGGAVASEAGAFREKGRLLPICGKFAGLDSAKAGAQLVSQLALKKLGEESETWRLRDWLISRQRYWGTPIPIIHCNKCGAVPVPDEDLPVKLPEMTGEDFKGKTGNPLERAEEWLNAPCPKCKGPATRETDTMDTFVDSSWYFMRFPDSRNTEQLFSKTSADANLPVDIYIGGIEHAILHLLYARFVSKFLTSISAWPAGKKLSVRGEPFKRLITQGMVHGKTYTDPDTGRFLLPKELDLSSLQQPKMHDGRVPKQSFEKMSKSKYNGVDPTALIQQYGADVIRAHTLFSAPVEDVLDWDDTKIVGASRWLNRLWRHVDNVSQNLVIAASAPESDFSPARAEQEVGLAELAKEDRASWKKVQVLLTSIVQAYETTSLNTLISDLMKLTAEVTGHLTDDPTMEYQRTSLLLKVMAPVTPAFAEECWQSLHSFREKTDERAGLPRIARSIFLQKFPVPDKASLIEDSTRTCTVQRNGKFKFRVDIPLPPERLQNLDDWIISRLKEKAHVGQWLQGEQSPWKRIVVIKEGKVVNFVSSAAE